MSGSLRRRLFLVLLMTTSTIWICAVVWIWFGSRGELEQVLDTRLQEAARMVHSLVASGNITEPTSALSTDEHGYSRQLSCQIWSLDGRLLARSSGAPDASLAEDGAGFANRTINDETWRVYTIIDSAKGVRVAVGDRVGLRDRLVRDLILGVVAPAALIIPLLGIMIWISLGRGLFPLRKMANDIKARDGEDMRPLDVRDAPSEIQPVVASLNNLFQKLEAARRHEREVTAFAAHELRTPLAGLKTQAQVALAADEDAVRRSALRQILHSVERTNRLIRQLLSLAKLEALPDQAAETDINVGAALRDVIDHGPSRDGVTVTIDPALDRLVVRCEYEALHLVLRNLHENAIEHSQAPGCISWSMDVTQGSIVVEDEGPGIPEDELTLVTQRFYRGRNKVGPGSGLGLTIASTAAARLGADVTLANRDGTSGLRCSIGITGVRQAQ